MSGPTLARRPLRVAVAIRQPILRTIVLTALACEPTVAVELLDSPPPDPEWRGLDADLLIVDAAGREPVGVADEILLARRRLRVLALTPDGQSAELVSLRPDVARLQELSPERLRSLIRSLGGLPE